jgi:Flp pilus assembly protein TadD
MKRIAALALALSIWGFACAGSAPLPAKALELNRAGVDALAAGDLETADARFSLALEYNPNFVDALTNQGLVELQRGNFERARQLLTRA